MQTLLVNLIDPDGCRREFLVDSNDAAFRDKMVKWDNGYPEAVLAPYTEGRSLTAWYGKDTEDGKIIYRFSRTASCLVG